MTLWESGRESALLDDMIAGRKTIEGRLNTGKFAQYHVGDTIKLRRDLRGSDGTLRDGKRDVLRVKIVGIRQYSTFLDMVTSEGYEKVIPSAQSVKEAADVYNRYYSLADQDQFGVLAIEVTRCP